MSDPVLDIEDLTVHFESYEGQHRVLNGVDLTVKAGETVAIVGETGCGKSVTAKSVMGTLPVPPGEIVDGHIRYRGTDLLADEDAHSRVKGEEMSMIFQDPMTYLSPVYTVGSMMTDIVTYGDRRNASWWEILKNVLGRNEGAAEIREESIELFEKLQIPDPAGALDKYPIELSGGMRQRIIIAMALINEPEFLIADEPTTALDVTVQDQILDLLKERIQDRGLSMLYITHNLGVARELADRIYIMYAGEIAEVGDADDLFGTPLHPYTRGLLDSIPKLTGFESEGIDGQIPSYTDPPAGCRFHPRCPAAIDGTCDSGPLPEFDVSDERTVRCHLYDEGMTFETASKTAADAIEYRSQSAARSGASRSDEAIQRTDATEVSNGE